MEKEKKEIGMEKLIELFKEYVDNHGTDTKDIEKEYGVIDYGQGFQYGTREYLYEIIVSKKFGFIKWLVENEKIDGEKFQEPKIRGIIGLISNWHNSEGKSYKDYSKELAYESLLMLLSISSSPIEDLISYLK